MATGMVGEFIGGPPGALAGYAGGKAVTEGAVACMDGFLKWQEADGKRERERFEKAINK